MGAPTRGERRPGRKEECRAMTDMCLPETGVVRRFLPTESIVVRRRARSLNTKQIEALMESIEAIGLRSPITVRIAPQDGIEEGGIPILVTGLNRLEAVK